MKQSFTFTFLALTLYFLPSFGQESISLANLTPLAYPDAPIIIKRAQLKVLSDTDCLPILNDRNGNPVPSQTDDLDGDGCWDELAFVYTLAANEKTILSIHWVEATNFPDYKRRTNIRYGKMTSPGQVKDLRQDWHGKDNLARGAGYPYQMDGIAWENDKMGFRHYFDGRNCRDVFGKRVSDMVLDTVGIKSDGCPGDTYHVLSDWGRDILSVVSSFGAGGLAVQSGDSLIRLGVTIDRCTDNVDTTRFAIVTEGPVRSLFNFDCIGWDVNGTKVNVYQTVTIWAGSYAYENKIHTSPLPQHTRLVTGLVRNNNNNPLIERTIGNKTCALITHDKQTYNKEYYLGLALLIPSEQLVHLFDISGKGRGIDYTWCAILKPSASKTYQYNVYAAWELRDPRFAESAYFVNLITEEAQRRNTPVIVTIIPNN